MRVLDGHGWIMKQLLQHASRMLLLLLLRTTISVNHHLDSTSRQTGTLE
jgi:hypothetical protein